MCGSSRWGTANPRSVASRPSAPTSCSPMSACRSWMDTASLRNIPVLLLTGAFEPVDEDRARATGCDGILVKPFEPQQLVGRVKELLAGRRSPALWPTDLPRVDPAPAPKQAPELPWPPAPEPAALPALPTPAGGS